MMRVSALGALLALAFGSPHTAVWFLACGSLLRGMVDYWALKK